MSNADSMPLNIVGEPLESCCTNPVTGFFRDGYCRTIKQDSGLHTVCAQLDNEFLQFSLSKGNDLITPRPDFDFPGLKAGNRWCLCAMRWAEAWEANKAPRVLLRATHIKTLEVIPLEVLKQYAIDLN
ncbi:DUF2237 domain-containing protein [Candidatus Sororendozoicomonas aggregata]|uniref:DUF2237 family protein n=1 Tax=Candidatus Sororendozoicomonas aggregata TaxID=3073239 RepID=UPI002ED59DF1